MTEVATSGLAVTEVADVRVAAAPVPQQQLSAAVRAVLPEAPLLGTGPDLAVLKGVGDPVRLAESFGLAGRGGYQAAGHTRMATESAVTVAHGQPFSPAPGLCLVHNGSFANHDAIRRRLRADGMEFGTKRLRGWPRRSSPGLAAGDDLETALHAVCATFDGFYTLLVTTPRELAVVRDAIAYAALIAEGDDWVAMASEYRALAGLPGIGRAPCSSPRRRRSTCGRGEPPGRCHRQPAVVRPDAGLDVCLDAAALGARGVNARLRELPAGAGVTITSPGGRHNLAVGLTTAPEITIDGTPDFTAASATGPESPSTARRLGRRREPHVR